MAELASLQIKVVRDGIEQAQKALNDLAKAADDAEKKTEGLGDNTNKQTPKMKSFAEVLGSMGKTMAGLGFVKTMADFTLSNIQAAAAMEQTSVAFTTLLGSAQRAKDLLSEMQTFAASTPFEFTDVATAGKQMLAYGFAAEQVIGNLRMLGDVASGVGAPIGDLVYLYGTLKSQGTAHAMDIQQFASRGIPIYEELAKVLNISTSEVKDFVSKGKVGFKEVEKAFQNMTAEGSKFGGMMDAQSKTLAGQWSNFKDGLGQMQVILGKDIAPTASAILTTVNQILSASNAQAIKQQELKDLEVKRLKAQGDYYKASVVQNGLIATTLNILNGTYETELKIAKLKNSPENVANDQYESLRNFREREAALLKEQGYKNEEPVVEKKGGGDSGKWDALKKASHDAYMSGMTESVQIAERYDIQIAKIQETMKYAKKGGEVYKESQIAERVLIDQKNQAIEESLRKLEDWDKILNDKIYTSLVKIFKATTEESKKMISAFAQIGTALANTGVNAAVDGFETLGASFADGSISAKDLKGAMAEIFSQLLQQLPMLMVQAGLQLIATGQHAIGLGFVAAGLAGSFVSGYVQAKTNGEEQSANGNVYGFADGGFFTHSVGNSPTRFMFAQGGGLMRGMMGEMGPEAVMPLTRMNNGKLGVASSGESKTSVTINNYSNADVQVEEKQTPNGKELIFMVRNIVKSDLANGQHDSALAARSGLRGRQN